MKPPQRMFLRSRHRALALLIAIGLLDPRRTLAQDDWQQQVRNAVQQRQIAAAEVLVDSRLLEAPTDMEAHVWRGRLLAWAGHWQESESEYRTVLEGFPNDVEVLTGLADVLLWQQKFVAAFAVLETARSVSPQNPEVLLRRGRVLSLLHRRSEARAQFRELLVYDPSNPAAIVGLSTLSNESKYEVRIADETDFFNYTQDAQVETMTITAHWNELWTSILGISPYRLFGENAVKVWVETARRFHQSNWVRGLVAGANPQDVVPESEALVEYGHGFRFSDPRLEPWFKGLESSWQVHSLWYRGAQVATLNTTQILYLPRDWTWTLSLTGSHTRFSGGESDWVPSGSTKVGFPLSRRLSGSVLFAVGAENFAQVDQIGRLSARTYGGGVRYRFAESQDVTCFVARQDRDYGQKQTSLGWSYGIRF